ncbi:hypothetical protein [Bacillus sp. OV322]|uniref:hypothetical protein n=1 Tax=Bacillus sp. OV322 TaxID=1882764 RepID=UPI0015A56814|nr:hypothetical protein [Bacillus sp. OV322]
MQQIAKLLTQEGVNLIYEPSRIRFVNGPYENYNQMIYDNGEWKYGEWKYGIFRVERQNSPYFKENKCFISEEEAAKYVFLKELSDYYLMNKFFRIIKAHKELGIDDLTFTEQLFLKAMKVMNITFEEDIVFFSKEDVKRDCLLIEEAGKNEYSITYFGRNFGYKQEGIPIYGEMAYSAGIQKVFLLHRLRVIEVDLLKNGEIKSPFSDEEVSLFLGY